MLSVMRNVARPTSRMPERKCSPLQFAFANETSSWGLLGLS